MTYRRLSESTLAAERRQVFLLRSRFSRGQMAQQNPIASPHTSDTRPYDPLIGARGEQTEPTAEARARAAWSEGGRSAVGGDPLESLTIDAAILGAATGDRSRFAELFQMIAPKAKAYLLRRGVTPGLAEDFAIQTMIEVWRTAKVFDPAAQSGQAWIFRILRTTAYRNGVSLPSAHQ